MADTSTKLPVKSAEHGAMRPWGLDMLHPFENLRRQMERIFDDFDRDFGFSSMRRPMLDLERSMRREWASASVPAVDLTETEKTYELTAEMPGMDEKNIEVKLTNGGLSIKGEKREEKERREKDYYLHERHFGTFERYIQLPEGIDRDKIEAKFNKGVLSITLPKTLEAQKTEKRIPVKGA